MKEERTHTRNQRRMYRIHKLEEKLHNQDLLIGSLQSQLKAKEEVIKEVTEYVETDGDIFQTSRENIYEILSKGENK